MAVAERSCKTVSQSYTWVLKLSGQKDLWSELQPSQGLAPSCSSVFCPLWGPRHYRLEWVLILSPP